MSDKAPPQELDATGRSLYKTLRKHMRDDQRWHESDHHRLTETCLHEMYSRHARDDLRDERGRIVLTAEGYKGQPTQHPSYKTFQSESKAYADGLEALGFSPAARARLGIELKAKGGGKFAR